ncbi:M48 family metalloprotease [candidate division KSB1 bacterium]|nr:M48 family metalloprotease [candidate division KSB1 bacterium]
MSFCNRHICPVPISLFFLLLLHCAGTTSNERDTLSFITIEEELSLGEELNSFTVKHLNIIRNSQLNSFLDDMAERIGAVSHWRGLDYAVFIINQQDINHFSLPGGNIFIFRGLLEQALNADEIASIIAHEIVHLSQRDAVAQLGKKYSYSFAAQQVIGENPEIAEHIIMSLYRKDTILDYPQEQETAADKTALRYTLDAGYDPRGMITILEKMKEVERQQPQRLELLRMTHASTSSRLRRIQKEARKLAIDPARFHDDTEHFSFLKTTLAKIPQ